MSKNFKIIFLLLILVIDTSLAHSSPIQSTGMPFHGCTFYNQNLVSKFKSCAEFSEKIGRKRCKKTKRSPPFLTTYPGSHLRMWLPDFFIEVTKHTGESLFAQSLDATLLKNQLLLASRNPLKNGSSSQSGGDNFWHARILEVPYNALANSYPPLPESAQSSVPTCFKGISEFYDPQWNLNLADLPYATAFAPMGIKACYNPVSNITMSPELKNLFPQTPGNPGMTPGNPCAVPVSLSQAKAINTLPTSEPARTISSPTRLCIGSWGPLIPRTGWIPTEDLSISALIAAIKFQSLTSDMQLSPDLAPEPDDKWQIVFPPQLGGGECFAPGSITYVPKMELGREKDEFTPGGIKKHHTYVIAVWRKKESCEEPLPLNGYTKIYEANFQKHKSLCSFAGGL